MKLITVTSPLIPSLDDYNELLKDIWNRKWLTNNGHYHQMLEQQLCEYLKVKHISLFSNGTIALITALQALGIKGEVITTPFSFVATTHSLWWNGITPVFVDIEPKTFNINPYSIEAAITENTTAIMPVHVYGNPCDGDLIKKIADKHKLKVIYDAAHAFGVEKNGASILDWGDLSVLSFHATKTYSTVEGGAIICHSDETKHHIDNLKNFGFRGETTVEEPGINGKMNELQAAYGLLNLKIVDAAIKKRQEVAIKYRKALQSVKGIKFVDDLESVRHNYSYFPIFVNEDEYGMSRDNLYSKLKDNEILGRRYFYPLITDFSPYRNLKSSNPNNIPLACKVASEVICLPMHHELDIDDVDRIINVIAN